MENKGLNIFNSAYVLADPNTATDADYEVRRIYNFVHLLQSNFVKIIYQRLNYLFPFVFSYCMLILNDLFHCIRVEYLRCDWPRILP